MRFAIAVLAAAALDLVVLLRIDQWLGAGALLSGLVQYWPRAGYANDLGVLAGFEVQLVIALVPYEIGGAIAGRFGGALRARTVPPAPRPGATSPAPGKPPSS